MSVCQDLANYEMVHPNRSIYDLNQNPMKRARTSGKDDALLCLTTGCSSLWIKSLRRFLCRILISNVNQFNSVQNQTQTQICAWLCWRLAVRWTRTSFCPWSAGGKGISSCIWCTRHEHRVIEPMPESATR